MLLIMLACERGCVNGLFHSDPYVLCKSLMSPNLTFLHHHMTASKYMFGSRVRLCFFVFTMTSVQSSGLSHSHVHQKHTQLEDELSQAKLPLLKQPPTYFIYVDLIDSALYATSMSIHPSINLRHLSA